MLKLYKSTRRNAAPVCHPDDTEVALRLRALMRAAPVRAFVMTEAEVRGLKQPVQVWHLSLPTHDAIAAAAAAEALARSPTGRELLSRKAYGRVCALVDAEFGALFLSENSALRWSGVNPQTAKGK